MQQLTYRGIETRDYKAIEALLEQTGYFEAFTPNEKVRKLVLEIYLRSCLEEQTYTKVVEHNGAVIGILCGRNDADSKRKVWTRYTGGLLVRLLKLHLMKEGRATINAYRGIGIGKQLTQHFLNHMQKTGCKSIYVYTDTGCNYGFYDKIGFEKVDERQNKLSVYLYYKRFKSVSA